MYTQQHISVVYMPLTKVFIVLKNLVIPQELVLANNTLNAFNYLKLSS